MSLVTGEETPGLGEVARRLDEVFSRLEKLVNDMPRTFVNRDLFDAYKELVSARDTTLQTTITAQGDRIKSLEDDKTWLYRLIVGAVVLALVSLSFTAARAWSSSSGPSAPPASSSSSGATK